MRATDLALWREIAGKYNPRWDDRAKAISWFIRPGDIVLDLGAGDQKLKKFLPQDCGYIPVDCVDVRENTFVVDFNQNFALPEANFNVIVSAGFLEYLNDPVGFIKKLSEICQGKHIIFSYDAKKKNKMVRRFNIISSTQEIKELFGPYIAGISPAARVGEWIFTGVISPASQKSVIDREPINDLVIRNTKFKDILRYKVKQYMHAR